jgi:hypothetical protein
MSEKNQLNLKNIIEGIMQDGLKKTLNQAKAQVVDPQSSASNINFLDPQIIKKIIQALPAETIDKIGHKIDGYKNESLDLIRNEVQKLFSKIDLQSELEKVLSKFIIEIHAEVRLIPQAGIIKPTISANAKIKMDEGLDQASQHHQASQNNQNHQGSDLHPHIQSVSSHLNPTDQAQQKQVKRAKKDSKNPHQI